MNQRCFRLVFDRRLGMCVPASEHTRGARKSASGNAPGTSAGNSTGAPASGSRLALTTLSLGLLLINPAEASDAIPRAAAIAPRVALPVRSSDTLRTAGDLGSFSLANPSANRLVVNQTSAKAIINWDSFDIAAGNTVQFVQPAKGSALNRIWDANPSVVLGRIEANGEVILQNTNGLIFGPTARVETGRFVATALQVAEDAFRRGIRGATDGSASLGNADSQRNGFVSIERGAEIRTAAGGDVLVFAPRVVNEGRIVSPGGQTVLGAGQTVYLAASVDPTQRGLIIGIQPFASSDADLNSVTQAASLGYKTVDGQTVADSTPDATAGLVRQVNAIVAERGSINLVGLLIRQNGLLQASTAVKGENGVIQLLAQAAVNPTALQVVGNQLVNVPRTLKLGSVTLGPASVTQVLPASDKAATQLDAETFNASHIRVEGERMLVQGGAQVRAPGGNIELLASNKPDQSVAFDVGNFNLSSHVDDNSRIVIESGAVISAAGLRNVDLPMSRNQLSGRLFQIELADSPVQRDGALYREEIFFDARNPPKIANVSGFFTTIGRTAEEYSVRGGTVSVQSDGGLAVDRLARIDVSGGSLRYGDGQIRTSLLRQGDNWLAIDKASAAVKYDELGNSKARSDAGSAVFRTDTVPGYVQGSDAGSATLAGRRLYFAGDVDGSVVSGPRQTGRGPDAAPVAGELVFGRQRQTDSSVQAIALQTGAGPRPDGLFNAPETAGVDDNLAASTVLPTPLLGQTGIGALRVYATDLVSLQTGAQVALGNNGQFRAEAGTLVINGSLSAPAGKIELTTLGDAQTRHDLSLGSQALLDTAGTWIDDSRLSANEATRPPALNGGSVLLSSASGLIAASGARIDVSAGARRSSASAVSTGKAGAITLALNVGADASLPLQGNFNAWQASLAGYDFSNGGGLAISGLPDLTLGGNSAADSRFNPAWFNGNGFGQITLASIGDLKIANTFRLDLLLANYLPDLAAGSTLAGGKLASVGIKPVASQRAAVSLSLQAATAPNLTTGVRGASLLMDSGAQISTEAGGSLKLGARRELTVGGSLTAPGGNIELALRGNRGGSQSASVFDDPVGFLTDQAVWLTPGARLSVAGTTELQADRLGRQTGTVYGGGTIALTAERGYVVAEAGATLDLRGAAATVLTSSAAATVAVSKGGGTLTMATPEGLRFDAAVLANAADAQADGGSLSVAISLGGKDRQSGGVAFPTSGRELHLGDSLPAVAVGQPGGNISTWLGNGSGSLSNKTLQAAGFSQITLKADDKISIDANLTLAADRSVTLDSRVLAAASGVEATVKAPYVALGDQRSSARAPFETLPASTAGNAVLDVRAGLIEVFGNTALQGYKFAALNATLAASGGNSRSDGEVRLVGSARGQSPRPMGSLGFSGELQVTAGQLYATTLSQFSITGHADANGSPSFFGSYQPVGGSSSAAPLSALASLAIQAGRIDIGGVVRQPFGNLALDADVLKLLAGSELSVAGTGNEVLVGTTVNGRQWQYRADGLFQSNGAAKPLDATSNPDILALGALPVAKGLSINGKSLVIDPAARLSAAGGGNLKAWEFVAGVGGSADTLTRAGFYAVLPNQTYEFGPSDSEVMASAGAAAPKPGAQIDITLAGSALAPGRYTLLPARYALLPGAVLVSLAGDSGKAVLTSAVQNDDGSAVVTGTLTGPGSKASGVQRFLVEPAATVLARSRLDVTDIGTLLTGVSQRLDSSAPVLPSAAGQVALQSQQAFTLATTVALQGVGSAAGGRLDIAVDGGKLAIVDDVAAPPASAATGWSLLSAAALGAGGAGSALVGGVRSADGSSVDSRASTVALLAQQQPLSAAELMLTGLDSVSVAAGSTLQAKGTTDTAPRALALNGDSAFLLVSTAVDTRLTRNTTGGATSGKTGVISVNAGATVTGPTLQFNAGKAINLSADANITTDHLALSTQRIAVGSPATAAADAIVIDGKLLAAVAATPWVDLTSLSSIDFNGSRDLHFDKLTLDAPNLRGLGGDTQRVRLQARQLALRNSAGQAGDTTLLGQGRLELQADNTSGAADGTAALIVGDSNRSKPSANSAGAAANSQFLGFGQTLLASSGDLRFTGTGRVVTQGDATLRAVRVTAASGADQGVSAPGALLRIEAAVPTAATAQATAQAAAGQGAQLHFGARRIEQLGRIDAPGGLIELAASGVAGQTGVLLGTGSVTSVAGYQAAATPTWTVYGDAGRVTVSAEAGSVLVAGRIDLSASGTASGGELSLRAPGNATDPGAAVDIAASAQLAAGGGRGGLGGRGGVLRIDAGQLRQSGSASGNLDALAGTLAGAGFDQALDLRVRQGDLVLQSASLRADQVTLSADQGSVAINGRIDARAAAGGMVRLFAGNDVLLGGSIDAAASRSGSNGGDVLLSAGRGSVALGAAARIDAGGDDAGDGRVVLRAGRDDDAGTVRLRIAPGFDSRRQIQAADVAIEAVRSYSGVTSLVSGVGGGSQLGQDTVLADSQAFAAQSSQLLGSLGLAGDTRASVRSAAEVLAIGNFTVADDFNLWQAGRADGQVGALTLRAAGNLTLAGSLSDGFVSASRPAGADLTVPTEMVAGPAWSFRLVAGADLGAANPMAVQEGATGDLRIAPAKLLRTTAGSIDLAAARDIVLAADSSGANPAVVYVAGRPSDATLTLQGSAWTPQFTEQGGAVRLTAGRDVVGPPATQLFGAWFYHTGSADTAPVAWWSGFDAFRQGVGSFGGGSVQVSAGRDVLNLGVVAPSSALANAAVSSDASVAAALPVVSNGGDIEVQAGRDIRGGNFFLGRGHGRLLAGGEIGEGAAIAATKVSAVAPVLGLIDGTWSLRASGDLAWAAVYNPTMLPSANLAGAGQQRIGEQDAGLFFSYASDSRLSAASQAGAVAWQAERPLTDSGMSNYWSALAASGPQAERIDWNGQFQDPTSWAPPIVELAALGGPLSINLPSASSGLTLYPSASGQLSVYAAGDLHLVNRANTVALALSDRLPAHLPSVAAPVAGSVGSEAFSPTTFDAPTRADAVVWDGLQRQAGDPVRLVAGGDFDLTQGGRNARVVLVSPKAADISAGGDIRNLSYIGQQASAQDVTSISAGGSFVQGVGAIANRITLAGPGELKISAGRQLDLGSSEGVESVGNLYAPALPSQGAAITLAAGLRGSLDVAAFTGRYLTAGTDSSTPGQRAEALADSYLRSTGKDPAALSAEDLAARGVLVQRSIAYLKLTGGDAGGLAQRRASWVAIVRAAQGLPALAEAELTAAFEPSQTAFKLLPAGRQVQLAEQLLTDLFGQSYLAAGQPYAATWQAAASQAGVSATQFSGPAFERVRRQVLFSEFGVVGDYAAALPAGAAATRKAVYALGFSAADLAGLGSSQQFAGDLDMVASGVQARNSGDVTLLAPGGQINVGLPGTGGASATSLRGVVTYGAGNISAFADGDFQVNSQRVFVVGQGNIGVWSSNGNIDAGRGANTAITVPPLVPTRQADGSIAFTLPSITVGSGIGILQPAVGLAAGNIGLYAPNGEVRALDAQIRAPGKITLAADVVRGADNIAGGAVVGAPPPTPVIVGALASGSSNSSEAGAALASANAVAASTSAAQERSSLLLVELLGLGSAAADEPPTEPDKDCVDGKRINADGSTSPCERGVGPGRQ